MALDTIAMIWNEKAQQYPISKKWTGWDMGFSDGYDEACWTLGKEKSQSEGFWTR
jgi:hypothetical protein